MGESAEPVGVYLEFTFSVVTLFLIFFFFLFFGFHWKEKMLILNVEVYKLLCYNKTNVYTKDLMLFYQNRCSTWPSEFDLHNDIMSNFVSLTSYFLIRTLQDDLRAMQIELKGCESCLNVSVTGWCGYSLLQWTCTHDFYLNLAFLKRAFSYLDIWQHLLPPCHRPVALMPSVQRTAAGGSSLAIWTDKEMGFQSQQSLGWLGVYCPRYIAKLSDSVNLGG